ETVSSAKIKSAAIQYLNPTDHFTPKQLTVVWQKIDSSLLSFVAHVAQRTVFSQLSPG
ncbi:hypothetical protein J6590_091532, partial [Homalodisca vitripennis]